MLKTETRCNICMHGACNQAECLCGCHFVVKDYDEFDYYNSAYADEESGV
ncbi:MAG: hypothetical protein ACE5J2_08165 [Nitrososphaerales archaeon]